MDYDRITKLSHQVDDLGILTPRQQEAWVVAFDIIHELRGHAAKAAKLESQVIGLARENQDKTAEAYDLAKKADRLKDRVAELEDGAVNNMKRIAAISHHGYELHYDVYSALREIRRLSLPWWDSDECDRIRTERRYE